MRSFPLGQRSRAARLLVLAGLSLVVSYGLLRFLAFSAQRTLPPFQVAPLPSQTVPSISDPSIFFYENFESFQSQPWKQFVRNGKTNYQLFRGEGGTSLKAVSRASASGLVRDIHFRAQDYPILSWRWKVEHPVEGADLKTKKGSDAAARIYVIFEGKGPFSMEHLLNYVWAWNLPKEETSRSYFSKNSRILVVENAKEGIGEWRIETRNLLEDYRKAFGDEPPAVKAIALMTDTDNTGKEAIAYYDDLRISR